MRVNIFFVAFLPLLPGPVLQSNCGRNAKGTCCKEGQIFNFFQRMTRSAETPINPEPLTPSTDFFRLRKEGGRVFALPGRPYALRRGQITYNLFSESLWIPRI
jgi:hypothetical protein